MLARSSQARACGCGWAVGGSWRTVCQAIVLGSLSHRSLSAALGVATLSASPQSRNADWLPRRGCFPQIGQTGRELFVRVEQPTLREVRHVDILRLRPSEAADKRNEILVARSNWAILACRPRAVPPPKIRETSVPHGRPPPKSVKKSVPRKSVCKNLSKTPSQAPPAAPPRGPAPHPPSARFLATCRLYRLQCNGFEDLSLLLLWRFLRLRQPASIGHAGQRTAGMA